MNPGFTTDLELHGQTDSLHSNVRGSNNFITYPTGMNENDLSSVLAYYSI